MGDPRARGALKAGIWVNGALAVVKTGGGLVAGSPSLLADGYHSIGDVLTSTLGFLSYRWAQAPPDEDHHYGHGKYEAVAAGLVGAGLVVTGATVMWGAGTEQAPTYAGSSALLAVGAALVSILGNEYLARVQGKAARETGSPTLEAMAKDNRSDCLSSGLVIAGVLAAYVGISRLEPIATGLIGLMVLLMGFESLRNSWNILTDRIDDPELRGRIEDLACSVVGVRGVQSVAAHPLGSHLRIDMEISVDGDLSVRKGHEIAHEVASAVTRGEEEVVEVAVHVNPAE